MRSKWDLIMLAPCFIGALMTVGAVNQMGTEAAFRRSCAKNLAELGRAMLIYSNDYEDELAMAGGLTNEWVPKIPNWMARTRRDAYAMSIDRTGGGTRFPAGKTTITSNLYLLAKYVEAQMPDFVCPSEPATRPFELRDAKEQLPRDYELIDAWDFGGRYDDCNNPSRHCSYSYHVPFDRKCALTLAHNPGMAILADRNPWIDPKRVLDPNLGWARFMEASGDSGVDRVLLGNSDAHQREGQNVLFLDSHVAFKTKAACGVNGDNIYTIAPDSSDPAKARQIVPQVYGSPQPADRKDSVLVQELPYIVRQGAVENGQ